MLEYKTSCKQCLNKKHNFIVSGWVLSATKKIASSFVCQNCLLVIDKSELETLNQYFHDVNLKTKEMNSTE